MELAHKQRALPLWLPSTNWLIFLAGALVFAVTYTAMRAASERAHDEILTALDAQARFSVISIDTRLAIEVQQLRDLAASERLKRRQLDEFFKEARLFAQRTRRQVVLLDVPRNTQLFNTAYEARLADGARFMQKTELDSLRPDRAYISNLFYAPLVQKNLLAVGVPVSEGGRVLYLLGVALDPAEILTALKDVSFVAGTTTTVVDRNGVILARSAENDRYAGRKAPGNAAERPDKSGRFKSKTFDGTPIEISYLQSDLSGWAVVSFVPDRRDSHLPLAIALVAALAVVVLGSLRAILLKAGRRQEANP